MLAIRAGTVVVILEIVDVVVVVVCYAANHWSRMRLMMAHYSDCFDC